MPGSLFHYRRFRPCRETKAAEAIAKYDHHQQRHQTTSLPSLLMPSVGGKMTEVINQPTRWTAQVHDSLINNDVKGRRQFSRESVAAQQYILAAVYIYAAGHHITWCALIA